VLALHIKPPSHSAGLQSYTNVGYGRQFNDKKLTTRSSVFVYGTAPNSLFLYLSPLQ